MTIAILGTGRLGTSLALALAVRGSGSTVLFDTDPAAARRARRIAGGGRVVSAAAEAARAADIVLLCVPDAVVAPAATRLSRARIDWTGKVVLHTSGVLSSAALAGLRRAGASVGSFHPAQSFARPATPSDRFRGIAFAVEGDAAAVAAGRRLARALGGIPVLLRAEDKPVYHAACSIASNLLVPLYEAARALLRETGIGPRAADRILLPLVEGTVANLRDLPPSRALTGPIARGDVGVVKIHLAALRKHPRLRELYRTLGRRAVALAAERGLPAATIKSLERRLRGR